MRKAACELSASSYEGGERRGTAAARPLTEARGLTWRRCQACGRLAYAAELCFACAVKVAQFDSRRAVGLRGYCAGPEELHRWLRRRERREALRHGLRYVERLSQIVGYVMFWWAIGYLVVRFGMMFWAWLAGR